jgi:hypothetical protein
MATELEQACSQHHITVTSAYVGESHKAKGIFIDTTDSWECTIHYNKRQATFEFHTGIGLRKQGAPQTPSAADLLYCLMSDAAAGGMSFEDFCSAFGYDTDSRKAEAAHKACKKAAEKPEQLLGTDLVRELQRKDH